MPFIVNPKPSVMTFGYEKCRCEFTMQSVQEITKLSITKVFPLKMLCKDSHNVFCRLADGDKHLEPTTSRPMYMGVVGRLVVSGRKRLLRLTSTHLKAGEIQASLMRIGELMRRISAIAEQLDYNRVWELIILAAFRKWLGGNRAKGLLPQPLAAIG